MPFYKTAAEKPHPGCLTVKEASELTGYTERQIKLAIQRKELSATKHTWMYGIIMRRAYFIPKMELMRWVGWRATKHLIRT